MERMKNQIEEKKSDNCLFDWTSSNIWEQEMVLRFLFTWAMLNFVMLVMNAFAIELEHITFSRSHNSHSFGFYGHKSTY